ncbi:Chromatin assembly complex, subunit 3 [Dissostichus eleginoides]|nr:Chromatin assembly complex, subunit 3 [Dissostichus eleginoides]
MLMSIACIWPAPLSVTPGQTRPIVPHSLSACSPARLGSDTRRQHLRTTHGHAMETEGSQSSLSSTDSPHDPCKMFIGGLSWQTTQEGLKEYFCKYGEVKECMVMRDPVTKRSRGFGFVTFVDQAGVDKVLAQTRHELDSKTIDPKVAFPRRAQPKLVTRTKKIFVGGLSVNTTIEDVKQYFDQFGKVDDAMLMFDKTTNRHRGESGGPDFLLPASVLLSSSICSSSSSPSRVSIDPPPPPAGLLPVG